MKRSLLLLVITILTITGLKSQTSVYQPFPISNAFWSQMERVNGATGWDEYGIFGDTLINSTPYHKVYKHQINCNDTLMTMANSKLIGAIREDNTKKVYFFSFANFSTLCKPNTLYKLYDFSKQNPGDTIQFPSPASGNCYEASYLTIQSVDSVRIDKKYRKSYQFKELNEVWIEGIGSLRGLFSTITPHPTCACTYEMLCFRQDKKLAYVNPAFNYCYCNIILNTGNIEKSEVLIFAPNPFSNETQLNLDENLTNAQLFLYDAYGRLVRQVKNVNGRTIILKRENLSKGLYYVYLLQGDKSINTKIILADN